jgi:SPP1 gp7 family putative phage head morphogenesis protein
VIKCPLNEGFLMRKKQPKTLPAIHPNLGIERWYKRQMMTIINDMRAEVNMLIMQNYKSQAKTVAMDGISDWLGHSIDYLMDKWNNKLNALADEIAELFVTKTVHNYDSTLKKHLRKAGFTVKLKLTPFAEEALKASIGENVGLIKSIGVQYLGKVEQAVWASVKGGFDMATLTQQLQHAHHITRNRAELIARDQSAKAMSVIEIARRKELGIKEAIWKHSHAGKKPRESHKRANGQRYDIDKGCLIEGEYIQPGEEINCRCGSQAIIEGIVL